ncbi:MAG: chlorite dismutase family protein [Acidobacteria bacterium]|nr:chlorite dismutase family protein [Acidobacteriota bacterium]
MECLFVGGPALIEIPALEGERRNRYRVDTANVVAGPAPRLPEPGWEFLKLETEAAVAASADIMLRGVTGAPMYTSSDAPTSAANGMKALAVGGEPVLAVIIPIGKTDAWWALPEAERKSHFHTSPTEPRHTKIGEPYVPRIHRRLFYSRGLETAFDFITYFEFRASDEEAFRKLVTALRDTTINPEWGYVDREFEIWMTKIA